MDLDSYLPQEPMFEMDWEEKSELTVQPNGSCTDYSSESWPESFTLADTESHWSPAGTPVLRPSSAPPPSLGIPMGSPTLLSLDLDDDAVYVVAHSAPALLYGPLSNSTWASVDRSRPVPIPARATVDDRLWAITAPHESQMHTPQERAYSNPLAEYSRRPNIYNEANPFVESRLPDHDVLCFGRHDPVVISSSAQASAAPGVETKPFTAGYCDDMAFDALFDHQVDNGSGGVSVGGRGVGGDWFATGESVADDDAPDPFCGDFAPRPCGDRPFPVADGVRSGHGAGGFQHHFDRPVAAQFPNLNAVPHFSPVPTASFAGPNVECRPNVSHIPAVNFPGLGAGPGVPLNHGASAPPFFPYTPAATFPTQNALPTILQMPAANFSGFYAGPSIPLPPCPPQVVPHWLSPTMLPPNFPTGQTCYYFASSGYGYGNGYWYGYDWSQRLYL